MPQVFADPEGIESFIKNLKQFNKQLSKALNDLKTKFKNLGDIWHDQEYQKFAKQFNQTMQELNKFIQTSEQEHIPLLSKKVKTLRGYQGGTLSSPSKKYQETVSLSPNTFSNAASAACGDGACGNEAKLGLDSFTKAADFGIQTYNKLRTAIKGTGLQAHHIIEKRFVLGLDLKSGQMPSIALTPEEHQQFTNAWRSAIAYNNSNNLLRTSTATREQIWAAAQDIYARYPELLEVARKTLFGTNP